MTNPSARTEPAPPKRSGCGARGCLLGCLAPIAVLGLAVLFALPTLRQKWTAFQDKNPWVSAVPGVASVLKDVAGSMTVADSETTDTAAKKRASRALEGVNDKGAMPRDLPLWPRPKVETFSAAEDHAAAYQRARQPSDTILRYFKQVMPSQGWRLDQERKGAGGTLLLYRKPNRIARVEVVADTAGTDIWLRTRSAASAGRK